MSKKIRSSAAVAVPVLVTVLLGCKSYWIDVDVENHTGQPIRQLEVEYPTASFGINSVGPESAMHYRFQVRGTGPIRVSYLASDGETMHSDGPTLSEHQHGQLTIELLPGGKSKFAANIQPQLSQPVP